MLGASCHHSRRWTSKTVWTKRASGRPTLNAQSSGASRSRSDFPTTPKFGGHLAASPNGKKSIVNDSLWRRGMSLKLFALEAPPHVDVAQMFVLPTDQPW